MTTTDEKLPPPGFRHMFKPGEMISEDSYDRFHRYLEPKENEASHDYARRLGKLGWAVPMGVEDARNIAKYRELLGEAADRELPIIMMTGELPDHYQERQQPSELRDPAKLAAYIEAERAKARPFPR